MKISLYNNPAKHSEGKVHKILPSSNPQQIRVVLNNGDQGILVKIINSDQHIEERIMSEDQHTENKLSLAKPIMFTKVLPQTIQSFLNSDGGRMYIGVQDTGNLNERLVGLEADFDVIRKNTHKTKDPPNTADKLCDIFEMNIMVTLGKYLASDAALGSLVSIKFPKIKGVTIAEITVKKSEHPWFYKNLNKNNKARKFNTMCDGARMGDRHLDDFYIRCGNSKKRLDTIQEFYNYAKTRFKF